LAAILFPVFAQAREKARQTSCVSNHKQVGTAMMMYAQDYDESFTPLYIRQFNPFLQPLWPRLLQPYIKNNKVFLEPSNNKTAIEVEDTGDALVRSLNATYPGFFPAMGRNSCVPDQGFSMAQVSQPADSIAFCDARLDYPSKPNALDNWGYYLVWWRGTFQSERLCPGTQAGYGNYAPPALWHSGGANATFFDGHAKWIHERNLRSLPAQYQANPTQWKLWWALN
jgi:prepilin-type processing-associated H-X9-DG protein